MKFFFNMVTNHNYFFSLLKCDKQKAFEVLAANLRVDENGVAMWGDVKLVDQSGRPCTAPTVRNGRIS